METGVLWYKIDISEREGRGIFLERELDNVSMKETSFSQ